MLFSSALPKAGLFYFTLYNYFAYIRIKYKAMKHLYGILAGVVIAGNLVFAAYWIGTNRPQPAPPPVQVTVTQPEPEKPKGRIRDDVRYNSEIEQYEWLIDGVWKQCRFEDALIHEGDVIGIYPPH